MTRRDIAEQNFLDGYNCTQAVLLAFEDKVNIDRDTLLSLGSPFGGGMGRLREVCGTVSAMFILLGLICGYPTPEKGEKKLELYRKVQALATEFENKNGSMVCRELLGLNVKHEEPKPEERSHDFYSKRPCKALCGDAAEIFGKWLEEQGL